MINDTISSVVLWENHQTATTYRMVWVTYQEGTEERSKAIIEQLGGQDATGVDQWNETPMAPWVLAEDFARLLMGLMKSRGQLEGFLKSLPESPEKE
jgi:hypothetical protein